MGKLRRQILGVSGVVGAHVFMGVMGICVRYHMEETERNRRAEASCSRLVFMRLATFSTFSYKIECRTVRGPQSPTNMLTVGRYFSSSNHLQPLKHISKAHNGVNFGELH